MVQRKQLLWALLLAVVLFIPSLAGASIKRIPPKYLPVDNGGRSDFALKMNDSLFNWIEDVFGSIFNYERCGPLSCRTSCDVGETAEPNDDGYLELEELLNEYVFGANAVPGSTVVPIVPDPLFAPMCLDIPVLGMICLTVYMRDNDIPGDNAVVSFNDRANPACPEPFILQIQGDSGSVWELYSDDNLEIEIIVEEIEADLMIDEPTSPTLIKFTYPNNVESVGGCEEYVAQQWDARQNDGSTTLGCVAAGGATGNIDIDGNGSTDYSINYTRTCQAVDGAVPTGSVWADLGDVFCDYPSPNSATAANSCAPWREAGDQWDLDGTSPYTSIAACGDGNVTTPAHAAGACTFYAGECDLTNWLSLSADITIGWDSSTFGVGAQDLHIGIGLRPLFAGNGTRDKANTAIGIELQHLDFGTNLVFELNVTVPTDHPQYEWSADIDAILPVIDMAIRAYMEDLFKCGDRPGELPPEPGDSYADTYEYDPNCVGYYIGATQLLDLADLLSGFLPFLHPLIPYYNLAPLPGGLAADFTADMTPWPTTAPVAAAGINLDFGIVSDFMAETSWGAMMPANLYLDIQMVFMDASTDPPVPFTDPATYGGYIPYPSCTYQYDGRIGDLMAAGYPGRYAPNPATVTVADRMPMFCDPPEDAAGVANPACNTADWDLRNTNPAKLYYDNDDGGGPIIFESDTADRYATIGGETMNFLQGDCNPLLDAGDPPAGGDPRPACTGDYMLGIGLHQDVLSELVYGLVASGVLCLTIDPTQVTGNSILDLFNGTDTGTLGSLLSLSTGNTILAFLLPELPANFGSDAPIIIKLVPYMMDPRTSSRTFKNIPRAWTGGKITEVIDNFGSPATNNPATWYTQTQWTYGMSDIPAYINQQEVDVSIDIPHLLIEFWTRECTSGCTLALPARTYQAPQRVFSLDLGFRVGLDVEVLSPMPTNNGDQITFPSGATWAITSTARTIFLGLVLDPNVKMLFSYLELPASPYDTQPCDSTHPGCTNLITDNYQSGANSAFQTNGYVLANLENYMGNLLTTVMSMIAQLEVRITIDLGARGIGPSLPPIPIAVNASIQPSCNAIDAGQVPPICYYNTDQELTMDADNSGAADCAVEGNCREGAGYGDFLQIYMQLVGSLPTAFIFQFLTCALLPDDPSCSGFAFSLASLGLAPAGSKGTSELLFETPGFSPPETMIHPVVSPNPFEMVVSYEGLDDNTAENSLRYSWRLDSGAWRPFLPVREAVLRGLGDGVHTFEVRAIDQNNYLEPEAAKVQFVVDGMGPDIYLEGDQLSRVESANPVFYARAWDHVYRDKVELTYNLDGKEWASTDGEILLSGLSSGTHVLNLRAVDPKGNVSTASHNFSVDGDEGYGCSSSPRQDGGLALLLLLAVPFALLRRKSVRQ